MDIFDAFAWIEIAANGLPYDPKHDLVFALDRARVVPATHAAAARRFFDEWGPFEGTPLTEIQMHASVVARKCGGRIEDLAALLARASRDGRFPEGRQLTGSGPPLAVLLTYLSRLPSSDWPRIVTAVHHRCFPFMGAPDELLMALLNYRIEQRAGGAPR